MRTRWCARIRYALKDVDGTFAVRKTHGRVYVDCEGEYDQEDAADALSRVFGIVGICPVVRLANAGFDQLKEDIIAYVAERYPENESDF